MEDLREEKAKRNFYGKNFEMFGFNEKTKRGGVMKKVLIALGALFCLMIVGGGVTGCTIEGEVEVGLTKYTITLDPQGGKVPYSSFTGTYLGTKCNLPTPAKTGYYFEGWYEEGYNGIYDVGACYTITKNSTLYAQWRPIPGFVF